MRFLSQRLETTPLLQSESNRSLECPPSPNQAHLISTTYRQLLRYHWKTWKPIYLCALFTLTVQLASELSAAPSLRMIELAICRHHYNMRGSIPNDLCSSDDIQRRVANFRAVLGTLETLPGLFLAVPYGMLADKKGRKLVITISMVGIVLTAWSALLVLYYAGERLPWWTAYTYPIWYFLGGGGVALGNLLLAVIADITTPEIRTRAFFFLQIVGLVTGIIGPPVSAVLMNIGTYEAYSFSISVLFLAFPLLIILPGTDTPKSTSGAEESSQYVPAEEANPPRGLLYSLQEVISGIQDHIQSEIIPLFKSSIVVRVLGATFLAAFSGPLLSELLQYMHVRYNWSYQKVFPSFDPHVHELISTGNRYLVLPSSCSPHLPRDNHSLLSRLPPEEASKS
jgi:MFS family permease